MGKQEERQLWNVLKLNTRQNKYRGNEEQHFCRISVGEEMDTFALKK